MQDPRRRQAETLEHELEAARVRLVALRLLRRDDPVEGRAESRLRGGEEVVVAVRDDAELEALVESCERGRGVRKSRPVDDRAAESGDLLRARRLAEVADHRRHDLPE